MASGEGSIPFTRSIPPEHEALPNGSGASSGRGSIPFTRSIPPEHEALPNGSG
jgi:hypothetical protein